MLVTRSVGMEKTTKGQYFSFDAIIAVLIFILTMVSLLSYWSNARSAMDSQKSEMTKEALRISDIIFSPPYSVGSDPCKIGFSEFSNYKILNYSAVENCANADTSGLKEKFGTPFNVVINFGMANPASDLSNVSTNSTFVYELQNGIIQVPEISRVQRISAIRKDDGETTVAIVEVLVYK